MIPPLLPCPFCGRKAKIMQPIKQPRGAWNAYCTGADHATKPDCGVVQYGLPGQTKEQVAELWNRRAPSTEPPVGVTEREKFEAWISAPPFERTIDRWPDDDAKFAWPGNYREYETQLAWAAWQARSAPVPTGEQPEETKGTKIARENRVTCNTLTDAQRAELARDAMAIAERDKWKAVAEELREALGTADDWLGDRSDAGIPEWAFSQVKQALARFDSLLTTQAKGGEKV